MRRVRRRIGDRRVLSLVKAFLRSGILPLRMDATLERLAEDARAAGITLAEPR